MKHIRKVEADGEGTDVERHPLVLELQKEIMNKSIVCVYTDQSWFLLDKKSNNNNEGLTIC